MERGYPSRLAITGAMDTAAGAVHVTTAWELSGARCVVRSEHRNALAGRVTAEMPAPKGMEQKRVGRVYLHKAPVWANKSRRAIVRRAISQRTCF